MNHEFSADGQIPYGDLLDHDGYTARLLVCNKPELGRSPLLALSQTQHVHRCARQRYHLLGVRPVQLPCH
ncbi:Uncharacterised protein [Vibrio cholerae]|nr:Uncharacterised protein [Vibrio cholerae]CSC46362.1 Uncharacterised protein [Vibrio cholerae]CSC70251.1 Uncharacterised protein [Vibrio cholerae]